MLVLTPIQSQVLAGLLAGKSVSAVARENDIHRSTIYTWRHEQPYFTTALDQARSRHQTALFDHVQDLADQALDVVTELLTAPDAPLRLRAAQVILRAAEPSHLSQDARTAIELASIADHRSARATSVPEPPASDTIRQNPTLESEGALPSPIPNTEPLAVGSRQATPSNPQSPSRNARCACGSGLKYKRCCGSGRPVAPVPIENRTTA